ncbi:hypothetical protein [Rhodococcus globerulus]|uniref:Uncharacterized protein n=1 Tax=Rhodococcus globerulus TaxID=33008 RepID=A0ABU4C3K1_RHOGO|nr:hypothetical protein [Rhodococcus globerulus]MDV6271081.1 hypothetical protein [Rhodococcus globerulus]
MTHDPLQDLVNRPGWYDDDTAIDRAYDTHVAQQLEHPAEFPAVKPYITWGCNTCGKLRSAPCASSCVFGGQVDPTVFKTARVEADRREAVRKGLA